MTTVKRSASPSALATRRGGRLLSPASLVLAACCLFFPLRCAHAAEPEIMTRDETLRSIDTVELFRNGFYWWSSSSCSGDVIQQGGASFVAYSDPRLISSEATRYGARPAGAGGFLPGDTFRPGLSIGPKLSDLQGVLQADCAYGGYFVRDDEAFYYAKNRTLLRKPIASSALFEGEPVKFRFGLDRLVIPADGALFTTDREVWFYTADFPGNSLTLQRVFKPEMNDLRAPREVLTLPGVSLRKFALVDIRATDGSYFGSELIALLPDGRLYRAGVEGGVPQLIRTGVADFAIRNETYLTRGNLGFEVRRRATTLYLALGHPVTHSGEGRLLGLDLTPGARGEFVEFNAGAAFRVTSVAVDASRIFLTRTPATGQANSDLLRRNAPSEPTIVNPGDPDYATIALSREFRSLRSTGRVVYFAHANTIQRVLVNAPAVELDFEAFGVEATQAIQDLNNSVPLTAGKRVIVRGFARLASNSTGQAGFDVPAQLRVYHAPKVEIGQAIPVEVPGSPFLPAQASWVTVVSSLQAARTNLSSTFQFEVPESVVREGELRFEFVLNAGRTVPETGVNPLANNTARAAAKVLEAIPIPLTMVPMQFNGGFYDFRTDPDFWAMIARAHSMLPVPALRLGFRNPGVSRTVLTIEGFKARSFDVLNNKDSEALGALDLARILDGNPMGGPYVGMFPPSASPWNGLGRRPGQALIIRMGNNPYQGSTNGWSTMHGGFNLAHEFGHNSGFKHVRNDASCGNIPAGSDGTTSTKAGNYDVIPGGSQCTLGATDLNDPATAMGFDPISWTLPLPASNGDLMSYANTVWISSYNWSRMLEIYSTRLPIPSAARLLARHAPVPNEVWIIQGTYNRDTGAMALQPVYQLPATMLTPAILAELTAAPDERPQVPTIPGDPIRLNLLDGAGNLLLDAPAPLEALSEGSDQLLSRALPVLEAARTLRLQRGAEVLAEIPISAQPPALKLDPPQIVDRELRIAWAATDADGDTVFSTVQLSPDDGRTWQTLQVNSPGSALAVSTDRVPGGTAARIRVISTDGVRSEVVTSEPFELPKHAPMVKIAGIRDGDQIDFGTAVSATGFGYDNEDGSLPHAALEWTLLGPEPRNGTGADFSLANLPPGVHTLILTGTDSDGERGSETLRFVIRALAVADGLEPVLDGLGADAGYGTTPPIRFATLDGAYAIARFTHANGALFACFTGLRYGGPNSPEGAVAGLRIDPEGSGAVVAATVGFAVDEHGHPVRVSGDGTKFVTLDNPPPGFSVVILRDENAWSAEMRIADELLGGWNGRLGLTVFADDGNATTPAETWPPTSDLDNPASWVVSQAGPASPIPANGNLLPFGNAEGLAGGDGSVSVPWPGWKISGRLTITRWDTANGYPVATDPGPEDRGANFFSGGPDSASSTATIRMELPVSPARIDAGQVVAELSGWFGGFQGQDDSASLKATFLTSAGAELESMRVGGFTAEQRQGLTALLPDLATLVVPTNARLIEVVLELKRSANVGFNDGYADNLSLILRDAASTAPPNLPPVADAGAPQTKSIRGGERITLEGGGSTDPEGAVLTYTWRQVSGPKLTFTDGATAKPAFTAPAVTIPTTFSFELVVNDGAQDSAVATTQVTLSPPDLSEKELVSNGSFENTEGTFVMDANQLMSLPAGSTAIPGWTTLGGELVWASNENPFGPQTSDGNFFVDLTGYRDGVPYGGVEQILATSPDHTYRLSLSVGLNHDVGAFHGPMTVAVVVAGRTNMFTLIPDPAPVGNVWGRFQHEFVAGTDSTRIAVTGASARGGAYLALDAVSLVARGETEELLVNGSFEDVEQTFIPDPNGLRALEPGSTAIPGWITLDAELVWGSNENPFGAMATNGSFFLDLTGYHDLPPYGGVSQFVTTAPGQSYELSFALGAYQGVAAYQAPVTVTLTVDSETRSFTLNPQGVGNQWGTFTLEFTATSTATPIAILGTHSTGGGYLGLDNVSVVETGVAPPVTEELRLHATVISGRNVRLSFPGRTGRNYAVESRASLDEGDWAPVPGLTAQGTDAVVEFIIPNAFAAPQQFYRVRRAP